MPPARPRSTKLMNSMISRGKLKNSRIHSAPGLINPYSWAARLRRKKLTIGSALFRENTGRHVGKRDRGFIANLYDLMLSLGYVLFTYTYFLAAGEPFAVMGIGANIDHILHATFKVVALFDFSVQAEFFWSQRYCH